MTNGQGQEKSDDVVLPFTTHDDTDMPDPPKPEDDSDEVFQATADGVEFRTVGWFKASVLFLKVVFAVGVLSLPTTLHDLGAVGGTLCVFGFGVFNTYCFVIVGNFRERHRGCHSIADTAGVVGGPICREIAGILFIIGNLLGTSSAIIGLGTAFNALSYHAICTVAWNVISAVIIAAPAMMRRFTDIGWVTYVGFVSIYAAVLIVVIGCTQRDRPAAAPQTGDFELGFSAIENPTFAAGMVAASTIFYSSSGTSAFLPIMSEMRNPKDYKKALYLCMIIVNASYIAFSMVMYKWAGKWIADPSLGTAGQTVKMVAYGVGLPGLIASGCIFLHVSSKYVFVRILRNSVHLQKPTIIHWTCWLGSVTGIVILAWIFAEVIPIFSYVLSLVGSVCYAPLAMMLPGWLWLYDHGHYRTGGLYRGTIYWLHWMLLPLGGLFFVGATYGVVIQINQAYADGTIGGVFSCADNSNST